jgi:hypothetical protein
VSVIKQIPAKQSRKNAAIRNVSGLEFRKADISLAQYIHGASQQHHRSEEGKLY